MTPDAVAGAGSRARAGSRSASWRRAASAAGAAALFYAGVQVLWPVPVGVVIEGLIVGAVTALIAFGIALVYRANGIINFAQADLGAVPAVLMATLITQFHWPYFAALPLSLAVAVVAGLIVERLIVRPFAKAPRLILMVATIGLAQILAGLATAIPYFFGGRPAAGRAIGERLASPFHLDIGVGPVTLHGTDVIAVVAIPIVILSLVWFLRRTPYGIAIRACAESMDRASLLGIDVTRIQSIVWVSASLLAAIGMVLRAGTLGLPLGSAFGPSVLLRALAAAVIGRMENYSRMFVAAVGFGVVETAILWNKGSGSLIDPAIFVIVVGFLVLQRRQRESRVADQAISSWRTTTAVRAIPRQLAELPEVRWGTRLGGVLLIAAMAGLPYVLGDARTNLAAALLIFCMIAASLVVLTGWAGELSLGQMALVGVGAAVAASINVHYRWDMVVTIFVAGLAGAIAALLIGLPALRVRGLFLAVSTLAFALATSSYLLNRTYFRFLPDNALERVHRLALFGRTDVRSEKAFYYVCLGALVVVLFAVGGLHRSRLRRVLVATRSNERTAQAFGIDLTRARLTAFAVSGFIAAFAGGLFTFQQQALAQQPFEPAQSIRVLTMVVVGGLASVPGALLGAVFVKSTEWFDTIVSPQYRFLFTFAGSGVGLLIVLRFLPGGLGELLYRARDRILRRVAARRSLAVAGFTSPMVDATPRARPARSDLRWRVRPAAAVTDSATTGSAPTDGDVVLSVRDLDVFYGPVQVLFGVDLEVRRGEMVALLGTNGAGKSTLLAAVSGLLAPASGTIVVDGVDATGRPAHHGARAGIIQVPGGRGVFPSLTVAEHLGLASWPFRRDRDRVVAGFERVLDAFPDLREHWDKVAGTLSGGQQQMLTLGMAFLVQPKLLMVDELSLGLAPVIVERLLDLVRDLNARGTTVILVEQSVNVALTMAGRAFFMEKGQVRFTGASDDLLGRPDLLRSVYLQGTAALAGGRRATKAGVGGRNISTTRPVVLKAARLSKRFGGRTVIDDVSLELHEGEILGLIGPNGAGKTTLFDLISGFLAPDDGAVLLDGRAVTRLRPDRRRAYGLGRSFQDARLFGDLTVLENLQVALDRQLEVRDPVAAALGLPDVADAEARIAGRAEEIVDVIGLGDFADKFVSELSTGTRRLVDIACQLALEPRVLLFDEPSSGIAQREAEALVPTLLRLRDETGVSLIVVEHDMALIASVADRLVALDLGRVICEGGVDAVLSNPQVIAGYLGGSDVAIGRSGARTSHRKTGQRAGV